MEKSKYYEFLETGKMHELGSVQNVMNPWAVFNPWTTQEQETQPKLDGSNEGSRFHHLDIFCQKKYIKVILQGNTS